MGKKKLSETQRIYIRGVDERDYNNKRFSEWFGVSTADISKERYRLEKRLRRG